MIIALMSMLLGTIESARKLFTINDREIVDSDDETVNAALFGIPIISKPRLAFNFDNDMDIKRFKYFGQPTNIQVGRLPYFLAFTKFL